MNPKTLILPFLPLVCVSAYAQEAPPGEAMKYHAALLKRTNNTTLFDRFFDAWIDEQTVDSLGDFLTARSESHGGADTALLARFQIRRGMAEAALGTLGKAIDALPDDPTLPLERARILLGRLDFASARADLEKVVSGKDEALASEAAKLIGKSHLREGDPASASKAWDRLLAKHPGDEDMLEDLVELAAAGMQNAQALAYSEKLIAATTDPYEKANRRIRRGELLAASGENDKAVALWSETLAQTGEGSWLEREIIDRIGRDYRRQDRIDSLVEKFSELAEKNPRRLLIHRELAKLEAASGEMDSAIGRFREVLRRSPGEAELREEFIRLLIDGGRFEDAAGELQKMIARSPEDAELHIRMADLAHRRAEADPERKQDSPPSPAVLAALGNARALLDPDEPAALRIASLMFGYGFEKEGEALLKPLLPSIPVAEALAAQFIRTERRKDALSLLEKISATADRESVLRATASIASLGQPETAFRILLERQPDFPPNQSYLAALAQFSLAAKNPAKGISASMELLRLAKLPAEIRDAVKTSTQVIIAAGETEKRISALGKEDPRSVPRTCLLASLLESANQRAEADALFEKADDPALLRFHASLLAMRNDLPSAIAVFEQLGKSGEGGKVSFFKELSELQLRAGQTADALETLTQWRTAAPTDKIPWIIAAQLLRETGKISEAMDMTRRALVRFAADEDLSLSLARILTDTGATEEASQIYWRLYDNAPDPSAQSRIAQLLASLAQRTGGTPALKEQFLERARSNSRSLGPVLALVEIARAGGDRDEIREHLTRALVIQPGNAEVRIQLGELEEQSGNSDAQIAILNEGIAKDPKGRIRSALAQAYIRRGDTMKGMRMLRALAGEKAADPRAAESAANSLASGGLYAEAISYLQESLPDGGDWHSRFLLALLLQEDGREAEAVPIFLSLLDTDEDIPGLLPAGNSYSNNNHHYRAQHPALPDLMELVQAAQQVARMDNRGYPRNGLQLPATPSQLRTQSLVRLAFMAAFGGAEVAETISAARVPDLPFATDLIASIDQENPDYLSLLEKHPTQPGLFYMALQYGMNRGADAATLKRLLAMGDLDYHARFTAARMLVNAEPADRKNWDLLVAAAKGALDGDAQMAETVAFQLLHEAVSARPSHADVADALGEILLHYVSTIESENPNLNALSLQVFALHDRFDEWIAMANSMVKSHRVQAQGKPEEVARQQHSPWDASHHRRFTYPSGHVYPTSLSTLPLGLLAAIGSGTAEQSSAYVIPATKLLDRIDEFDSPLLRAWIAHRSGDEESISDALSVEPPDGERTDFFQLCAIREAEAGNHLEACRIYADLREEKFIGPDIARLVDSALISLATRLEPEERKEIEKPLRAALLANKPQFHPRQQWESYEHPYTNIVKLFGFHDLVEAFTPPPPFPNNRMGNNPAAIRLPIAPAPARIQVPSVSSGSRTGSPRSAPINPIERFKEFARDGKITAASRELLKELRNNIRSGSSPAYVVRNIRDIITPEIRVELMSLAAPGDLPGLAKRREYVEICLALGERKEALSALEALAAERPFDPSVTSALAFLLPPAERDRAAGLLESAAESRGLTAGLNEAWRRVSSENDNDSTFAFFEVLAAFLKSADPGVVTQADAAQISGLSQQMFQANGFRDIPSALAPPQAGKKVDEHTAVIGRHSALARDLAIAMLRHPALSETGFRLLNAANWEEKPDDLDGWARDALLGGAAMKDQNHRYRYRSGGLPDKSSASYLIGRLGESPAPDGLFPAAYLVKLGEAEPLLAEFIGFLAKPPAPEGIKPLWESGAAARQNDPILSVFQKAATDHATAAPGANAYYLSRLREITPEEWKTAKNTNFHKEMPLLAAAIATCAHLDEKGVVRTCDAIFSHLFEDDAKEASDPANSRSAYVLQQLLQGFMPDPLTCVRILRAMDRAAIPLNDSNWIQSCFQQLQNMKPEEAVELFDSLGFLNKTSAWEPLAIRALNTTYDEATRKSLSTVQRTEQLTRIFQSVSSSSDYRKKITSLLENRTPRTFGSLLSAALLSSSGAERDRLAAAAFDLAAPDLSKTTARRAEDFALYLQYLPRTSTASLPPLLRAKAGEIHGKNVALMVANIEKQFEQSRRSPGNNLFGYIDNNLIQLAADDVEKAVSFFLEATELHFQTGATMTRGNSPHDYALGNLLRNMQRNGSTPPETALRFYLAVMDSPQGIRFGISDTNSGQPFLATVGDSIVGRMASGNRTGTDAAVLPWLAAQSLPDDLREDALAAVACHALHQGRRQDAAKIAKSPDLSERTRKYATAIGLLISPADPEEPGASYAEFATLLADPALREEARIQLAITAGSRIHGILAHATIAEKIADIFSAHCASGRSAVDGPGIALVSAIGQQGEKTESISHLKRISSSFWENANSPKAGLHQEIPSSSVEPLLQTAMFVGDEVNANRLFPLVEGSMNGRPAAILSMIQAGRFDFAAALLPDGDSPFQSGSIGVRRTPELERQLAAFRESGAPSAGLFRFEILLLNLRDADNRNPAPEKMAERKEALAAVYEKNLPEGDFAKVEILATLATSTSPQVTRLSGHVDSLAATFDPARILNDWSDNTHHTASAPHRWDLLCKSASNRLLAGDGSVALSICTALKENASKPGDQGSRRFIDAHRRFLAYLYPATATAVSQKQTAGFAKLVNPMADLTLQLSNIDNHDRSEISATLALSEFYEALGGGNGIVGKTLARITSHAGEYAKRFAFPRTENVFFRNLMGYRESHEIPTHFPPAFITELLTRPGLAQFLISDAPMLEILASNGFADEIEALEKHPQESFSPGGRALLAWHRELRMGSDEADYEKNLRECLSRMPDGAPWAGLRADCKVLLVSILMEDPEKKGEAAKLFESILPADVSRRYTSVYERQRNSLKSGE